MFDSSVPLSASDARKFLREILENGTVEFLPHALDELAKDGKTTVDATNVLRGGVVREAEWENGEWRHRVETQRMCVVITFDTETHCLVITAWEIK